VDLPDDSGDADQRRENDGGDEDSALPHADSVLRGEGRCRGERTALQSARGDVDNPARLEERRCRTARRNRSRLQAPADGPMS